MTDTAVTDNQTAVSTNQTAITANETAETDQTANETAETDQTTLSDLNDAEKGGKIDTDRYRHMIMWKLLRSRNII